jgi:hypothetical protein
VTAVSRFDKDCGRGTSNAPARLLKLQGRHCGPLDFWDRPDGEFGPLAHLYALSEKERERANSLYRLGSKALLRNDLRLAVDLLGEAATDGHPGALFRLALAALRAGDEHREEDAWFLIAEAARHGHGDARRLLRAGAGLGAAADETADEVEDGTCLAEIRRHLLPARIRSTACAPLAGLSATGEGREGRSVSDGDGAEHLVLVPAPALPPVPAPPDRDTAGLTGRPRLTALPGGLALPVPEPRETPTEAQQSLLPDGGLRWSVHALRPAALTGMARASSMPAVVPARWQTTRRARDLLTVIHQTGGIDTRALARRTGMSKHLAVQLLDWLREQRFVETVGGAHLPGPLLDLITAPGRSPNVLTDALAELRDGLGAAVYIGTYTDGEITIQQTSSSAAAPAVLERTPFGVTGHASAVGKSLLAQLPFPDRMEHLSRYPSIQLTHRTITDRQALFERLDVHGPHSAQFDLLEYSDSELCAAYSLGLPRRASSIAISLPLAERKRLIDTAAELSRRATGLLLVHLLTDDLRHPSAGPPAAAAKEGWPRRDPVPPRAVSTSPGVASSTAGPRRGARTSGDSTWAGAVHGG